MNPGRSWRLLLPALLLAVGGCNRTWEQQGDRQVWVQPPRAPGGLPIALCEVLGPWSLVPVPGPCPWSLIHDPCPWSLVHGVPWRPLGFGIAPWV